MGNIAESLADKFKREIATKVYQIKNKQKSLRESKKVLKGNKEALALINNQIKDYEYELSSLNDLDDGVDWKWRAD